MAKMSESKVVGFYHSDGLVPAWNLAKMFAGEGGRIATLPDIIEMRLNNDDSESTVWNTWFTTSTAEYFGIGKDGRKKIIVAHGIGPMSTINGILKAYSYEYTDKSRRKNGGRITHEEFLKLESGDYGQVEVLDYEAVLWDFKYEEIEYPFCEGLDYEQCIYNNHLRARLGPKAEEFIFAHLKISTFFSGYDYSVGKYIKLIHHEDANNCSYKYVKLEDGFAVAHLISIGNLQNVIQGRESSLRTDISCHEWSNGNRFVGIRKDTKLDRFDNNVDGRNLLKQNWQQLMIPVEVPIYPGAVRRIISFSDQEFTEYPKKGSCLNTGEPEFLVISKEPIGQPVDFQTTTGGSDFFFRYEQREVSVLAPPESNTYSFVDEIGTIYINNKPTFHTNKIQFYRAKIDYSQRLMRADQLARDYDKVIELIDK